MDEDEQRNQQAREYYQTLEDSIAKLPQELQGKIYRQCAVNCVQGYVLEQQRKLFEECHGDMDLMYADNSDPEAIFGRIIEKGHIYEMGYPRCLCHLYASGFAKNKVHCECSRQSILYILSELFPEKKIEVKIIDTVLNGASKCTFRIIVE